MLDYEIIMELNFLSRNILFVVSKCEIHGLGLHMYLIQSDADPGFGLTRRVLFFMEEFFEVGQSPQELTHFLKTVFVSNYRNTE